MASNYVSRVPITTGISDTVVPRSLAGIGFSVTTLLSTWSDER